MMLDDYKLEQPIVYKTLMNSIKNNKCSHAFIIEKNGYPYAFDFALAFAKCLLCPKSYSNSKKCGSCNQCLTIDKNEFIELKVIEPEGQWIKKSQLEELQELFSKKSVLGNKKVYIINGADKLNVSSSNSLLKFIEEPEDGIIAILITENIYQLLPTIVSRCQILSLNKNFNIKDPTTLKLISRYICDNENDINNFIEDTSNLLKIDSVIEFIKYYEKNKYNSIIYMNKYWHDIFKEKDEIYNAFTVLLLFYKDVLNKKINRGLEIFIDYVNDVEFVEQNNDLNTIIHKINVIMNLRENIKFNANTNLLMDKLIIELEGLI